MVTRGSPCVPGPRVAGIDPIVRMIRIVVNIRTSRDGGATAMPG
jgi:hypothetical protein